MGKFLTLILFLTLFILEGLGIVFINERICLIYLAPPALIFFFVLIKEKIVWPVKLSLSFLVFIGFSFVSSLFFAIDKQTAFEKSLFYLSAFLIFVFFYNQKKLGAQLVNKIIILGTPIFVGLYLVFILFFPGKIGNSLITGSSYNLIAPLFANHNHLGDFLGLGLIFFLYHRSFLVLPALFFFLISQSRSAYLAFLTTTTLFFKKLFLSEKTKKLAIFLMILTIFGGIYFSQTRLLSSRNLYWQQAVRSIKNQPFFGVGSGGFGYLSTQLIKNEGDWTNSTHNIFLEILVENGFFAFAGFVFFVFLVLKKALKDQDLYSALFIYLLINFQTDYTYQFPNFFILFMIVAGLLIKDDQEYPSHSTPYGFFSAILLLAIVMILASNILIQTGRFKEALVFYPLNKNAYQALLASEIKNAWGNYKTIVGTAQAYEKLYSQEPTTILFLTDFYQLMGDAEKALTLSQKSYQSNKFIDFSVIRKIYFLTWQVKTKKEADDFFNNHLNQQPQEKYLLPEELGELCFLSNNLKCKQLFFYEPEANKIERPNPWVSHSLVWNKFNQEGLNDRFNYPLKKEKDSYRIITLGNSLTYGLYVETKDNWPELLEELLNKNKPCARIKKFEVINFGYHGYDADFNAIRYNLRGKKYQPDLIVWLMTDDQLKLNRVLMAEKMKRLEKKEVNLTDRVSKEIKKGNYYFLWSQAKKEVEKDWGEEALEAYQKKQLKDFLIKNPQTTIINFSDIIMGGKLDRLFTFPDGLPNKEGYQQIAGEIYRYLINSSVIRCSK